MGNDGCLLWTGARRGGEGRSGRSWRKSGGSGGRYGVIKVCGTVYYVHRLSYSLFRGQIPEGHHVDHLCENPLCWSPYHLECVDASVNLLRAAAVTNTGDREAYEEVPF